MGEKTTFFLQHIRHLAHAHQMPGHINNFSLIFSKKSARQWRKKFGAHVTNPARQSYSLKRRVILKVAPAR
jgi:hypothetical protein